MLVVVIGYAGKLIDLFEQLRDIERREHIGNDQILLNMFYLKNPTAIELDKECQIFQNLWRTYDAYLQGKTPQPVV